jgi:hypothetical protein
VIAAVEGETDTDFAILDASQEEGDVPDAGGFIGTMPGGIAALCGTKYAAIRLRAERWDSRRRASAAGRTSTSGPSTRCQAAVPCA